MHDKKRKKHQVLQVTGGKEKGKVGMHILVCRYVAGKRKVSLNPNLFQCLDNIRGRMT
jgi:hypothetical protein